MAPMAKIDPKYDALFKSRVASRGEPQLTALQLIIHLQVQIAKKIELTKFLNIHIRLKNNWVNLGHKVFSAL